MKTVNLVLRPFKGTVEGSVTVGVDRGALFCLETDIPMIFACGDFDSVTPKELERIQALEIPIHQYPEDKDLTDFEIALRYVQSEYDVIHVYGAFGDRKDHEYLNVLFAIDNPNIVLHNENNRIQVYESGVHYFNKNEFTFFSIIPLMESVITLQGFRYNLKQRSVNMQSRYLTSNRLEDEVGELHVNFGKVLVIETKENAS